MKLSNEQLFLKSARRAKILINIALVLLAFVFLSISGYYFFDREALINGLKIGYELESVSEYRVWLYLLCLHLATIPYFIAVWSLRRVFVGMNKPNTQLENIISAAKITAWCLWINAVLLIFGDTIGNLIFYSGSPLLVERGFFSVDIWLPDILAIIAAIMATIMSSGLRLGIELWQENKEII